MNPVAQQLMQFYPSPNAGPNLFITTQVKNSNADQGGFRYDHIFNERDQFTVRYARSVTDNIDPLSISGANVPGFPVGEDIGTHSATISETHTFGSSTVNIARVGFYRNVFDTNNPINRTTPQQLGFNYGSTLAAAEGPPFFIVSGYASIGNPITGPRVTTQNTYEVQDLSLIHI